MEKRRKKPLSSVLTLRRVNNALTVIIIAINAYIIILPVMPQLTLWWRKAHDTNKGVPYSGTLAQETSPAPASKREPIPDDDRLVVPSLQLNEKIYEGTSTYTVNKGVWRRPSTSTPDQEGNTVLVGHRFTYKDPAVFYHLDKVKVGEKLAIYWHKKEYVYEVKETKVVAATAVEIEENTPDKRLTIYTCTPLWTAKDRLVIVAIPIDSTNNEEVSP